MDDDKLIDDDELQYILKSVRSLGLKDEDLKEKPNNFSDCVRLTLLVHQSIIRNKTTFLERHFGVRAQLNMYFL